MGQRQGIRSYHYLGDFGGRCRVNQIAEILPNRPEVPSAKNGQIRARAFMPVAAMEKAGGFTQGGVSNRHRRICAADLMCG